MTGSLLYPEDHSLRRNTGLAASDSSSRRTRARRRLEAVMTYRSVAAALRADRRPGCDFGSAVEPSRVVPRSRSGNAERSRSETASSNWPRPAAPENGAWVVGTCACAFAGRARTVWLPAGTPEAPGRLLYEFAVVNSVPASGVITQVFVRTPTRARCPSRALGADPATARILRGSVRRRFTAARRRAAHPERGSSDWQRACRETSGVPLGTVGPIPRAEARDGSYASNGTPGIRGILACRRADSGGSGRNRAARRRCRRNLHR